MAPPPSPANSTAGPSTASDSVISEFDQFHLGHITQDNEEGWASELQRYLKEILTDVTKDMDIIKWWQVFYSILTYLCILSYPITGSFNYTLLLLRLHLISSPVRLLQFHVSDFSPQVSKWLLINGC
jgi:hypothetical protein